MAGLVVVKTEMAHGRSGRSLRIRVAVIVDLNCIVLDTYYSTWSTYPCLRIVVDKALPWLS